MCNSTLSLTFFVYSKYILVARVKIDIRECSKWSLTTGQNQWKIINSQAQNVVAVAYRRWSFTRGSKCKALTGKIVVFRIGSRLWKVVVYERWSHMEVQLYFSS